MKRPILPILNFDLVLTRLIAREAPLSATKVAFALGWLCDARTLLSSGALWFLTSPPRTATRQHATRFLSMIATTTIMHHAAKRVIAQKRPDRVMSARQTSGRASDAMPSGHAMHAGAVASFLTGWVNTPAALWPTFIGLAAARIVVLAHWPSGVLAGFLGGVLVERCTRLIRRFRLRRP